MDDMFPETKFSFLGLERNPAVFERMQRNGAVLNLDRLSVFSSYYGDFEHFVETRKNPVPYQFIYLDCMGTWGEDKLQWIQLMFQNRLLAQQSWFRFTIGANRGHPHKWIPLVNSSHIPEPYHVQNLRSHGKPIHPWLINGIPRLIAEVGHTYGYEVVPRLCTIYHSKETPTSKGKPQLVYLFKVKRHKT